MPKTFTVHDFLARFPSVPPTPACCQKVSSAQGIAIPPQGPQEGPQEGHLEGHQGAHQGGPKSPLRCLAVDRCISVRRLPISA